MIGGARGTKVGSSWGGAVGGRFPTGRLRRRVVTEGRYLMRLRGIGIGGRIRDIYRRGFTDEAATGTKRPSSRKSRLELDVTSWTMGAWLVENGLEWIELGSLEDRKRW